MASTSAGMTEELSSRLQVMIDRYLAWQLQAEEYQQSLLSRPLSLFSPSAQPAPYQFQKPSGETLSFTLRATRGDGDCFFHAVDQPGFNREALVRKLLECSADEAVRRGFAHEIRQFLYLGHTGTKHPGREDEACRALLAKGIQPLFVTFLAVEEPLRHQVDAVRIALGEERTKGKTSEELLGLLEVDKPDLAPAFRTAHSAVLAANETIYRYCCQESVFREYVELYLRAARGYVPFSRELGAELPITTIDVINQLFGLKIQVYLLRDRRERQLQLANHLQTGASTSTTPGAGGRGSSVQLAGDAAAVVEGAAAEARRGGATAVTVEVIPIFHNGINHFSGLNVFMPPRLGVAEATAGATGVGEAAVRTGGTSTSSSREEDRDSLVQLAEAAGRRAKAGTGVREGGDSLQPPSAAAVQTTPLPTIPYDRESLDEIIVELPIGVDIKAKVSTHLTSIEKQVSDIRRYQSKRQPEHFYLAMCTATLEIRNIADELYELTKPYHPSFPNILKQLVLKWILPLEAELEKRLEMPASDRDALQLKTRHLYAEQSFISREASLQQALLQHLERLKQLFEEPGHPNPRCYISYAWPSEEKEEQEYWVQPFLYVLYEHLIAVGIRVVMDIRDNKPGDSIYQFMKRYHEGNYIILVGTESLLEKHYSVMPRAVQTELSIINSRSAQDQKQFGQSRIYPMLISGTLSSAYPERYQLYSTVRDARNLGYLGTVKNLADWIYEARISQIRDQYRALWQAFETSCPGLPRSLREIEQEVALGYHRQRLEFLRQDIQYQGVQAQEKTEHSAAVQTEWVAALMKSQGTNPQTLYDASGVQFQRPYTNPDFVQRQQIWDKMTQHFTKQDSQVLTLTAHGLGGMGKTELAGYYYLHPPRPYSLRAWFYAEKKEQLYYQYIALAAAHPAGIKFSKEMPVEEQARRIKEWLESQKDCLLVYDNVPNAKEIEELLPNQGKHHILMTSRSEVDWPVHQTLDVDVMEENEAIKLIAKIIGFSESEINLKRLVNTLGYLPLALAQAGAYIFVKAATIEEYLKDYQQYQVKLLSDKTPRSPKHEPVWITFDMNFAALAKDCPTALTILKQASWVSTSIPEILLQAFLYDAMKYNNNTEEPTLLWGNIKEHIRRYSLMRVDRERHQLSIHPLLQDILRSRQEVSEQLLLFIEICETVDICIKEHDELGSMEHKILLPHAERLHQHGQSLFKISKVVDTVKFPEFLLTVPNKLGTIYRGLGFAKKALTFYLQLLKVHELKHDKDDVELAHILNHLGITYGMLDNYKEQKDILSRALTIQLNPKDDKLTGVMLSNLGVACSYLENYKEAKDYLIQALTIKEKHYGPDHPEIAVTLVNLASVYNYFHNYEKAMESSKRALSIFESWCGKNHPRTADALLALSSTYHHLSKYKEEVDILTRALNIQESYYIEASSHPHVVITLRCLADAFAALGDLEKEIDYLNRALIVCKKYYGSSHPTTAHTELLVDIASGRVQKDSIDFYNRSVPIFEATHGPNHPIVLKNLEIFARTCFERASSSSESYERQLELLTFALTMFERLYGENHSDVATVLNSLGNVFGKLGDYHKKIHFLNRALVIQEKLYGSENQDIAITLANLGNAWGSLGKHDKKINFLTRALAIQEKCYSQKDHPHIGLSLFNLGVAYSAIGDKYNAYTCQKRSHDIFLHVYGQEDEHTKTAFRLLQSLSSHSSQSQSLLFSTELKEIALKLRRDSADEKIAADDNYHALVKKAVSLGAHLGQSSNGNTALHWTLINNQPEKAIVLLREIERLDKAFRALDIPNKDGKSVLALFHELQGTLPAKVKMLIEKICTGSRLDGILDSVFAEFSARL
jgi:tetratricopeptide (TPR) repeat protein